MPRVLLAFVLAPLTVPLLFGLQDVVVFFFTGAMEHHWRRPLGIALFAGYPVELVLGLPTLMLFRRFGWIRWWQFALAGAVIGALPGIPWLLEGQGGILALGAIAGTVTALVFWAVAVPRNDAFKLPQIGSGGRVQSAPAKDVTADVP